ncbi:MAG: hypothetical protein ABTQ34_02480 [Bdellovibrionales bacterium]
MKKLLALFGVALVLSACVTAQETYLQDGSPGHHITCSGSMLSMGDCLQKAGELCGPGGYKIYSQTGESIPYTTSSGGMTSSLGPHGGRVTGGYNSTSGAIVNRDLFVKCNREAVRN